ncbi:hypothetical protein LguiA_026378 [Lonicera macranthoides]
MHDLVHDLALSVATEEVSHVNYDTRNIFYGTHHLLFSAVRLEEKEFPHFLLKLNKVRSFSFQFKVGPISKTFVDALIKTFSYFRILDLNGSECEEVPGSVGKLKHLRMLNFPKKGHAEGLTSLQRLVICHCDDLGSLLGGMKNFTALRLLSIYKCPSLTSFPTESMKYLTSLEILWMSKCEKLNLLAEEDTMKELPRGFLSLKLRDIPKLKELPRGFENAAATIKYIKIEHCPSFEILPQWLIKCTSLMKLELVNCALLESLPLGMHQLTTLRYLCIMNCFENLGRKCKWGTGEYWPWISQIPVIHLK